MCSSQLRKKCSQVFPNLIDETNGCLLIDYTPLISGTRKIMLSHITWLFHVLLHSVSSPPLNNLEFSLCLFHPHHIPDDHFRNNLASPMVHAEVINTFLNDYSMKENVDFYHTLDKSLTNCAIHDHCMCDNAKITNAKEHLKQVTFKSMINQK